MPTINIMWFRRDLRLKDNAALYHALKSGVPVLPVFIFDTNILDQLEDRSDKRVQFIHDAISAIQKELLQMGSTLRVIYATPVEAFQQLLSQYQISKVFTNEDYEQYAIDRDATIKSLLQENAAEMVLYKDHVIFEKLEIAKEDGSPYTVFTPYSKKWKAALTHFYLKPYPTETYFSNFFKQDPLEIPELSSMDFNETDHNFPTAIMDSVIISHYSTQRDFPALKGTSRLGIHLRFGTISIRQLAQATKNLNEGFLNELIWRDFYHMILWNFPSVRVGKCFKNLYEQIEWRNNEAEFKKWCNGTTGYPIVDAGMRELNATGFMHNRVRMITASFLTKHLLIDWKWGEAYFASKLMDFDYAANNGGWQWAAGCGCDAAPYFRIFNPALQTEKFDKQLLYIRKWIPELDSFDYPQPMVVHEVARKRCLETYSKVLKKE